MSRDSLNSGDVFIVDAGLKIIHFNGSQAGIFEKEKAAEVAHALVDERDCKPVVSIVEESDTDKDSDAFWAYFGGRGKIHTAEEGGKDDAPPTAPKRLFRLSDATGTMKLTEVPKIALSSLDPNDVFIFDAGFEIFVWVGSKTSKQERAKSMAYATDYLFKYNRPKARRTRWARAPHGRADAAVRRPGTADFAHLGGWRKRGVPCCHDVVAPASVACAAPAPIVTRATGA